MNAVSQREFDMSEADFNTIAELAYKYTGIVLGPQKWDMVYGRLARRLRALKLKSVSEYILRIEKDEQGEISQFINAITTNLTSFFREQHHFDSLSSTILPELLETNASSRKVRVWSAGCSTGEEPYSIAISLRECLGLNTWDCKILATDLDSQVLEKAQSGIYEVERIESVATDKKKKWFMKDINHPDIVKVKPDLQELIRFKRLNLLESWPMKGKFDFIFCRNVLIYFNAETQNLLFEKYANALKKGGYLIIGHSESISLDCPFFKPIGQTIYKKV